MILLNNSKIIFENGEYHTLTSIPKGVWMLLTDKDGSFYLSKAKDFTLPETLYGDVEKISDRYIRTFNDPNRDHNLGIVLSGCKGTGKSITAKMTALKADIPIIIIASPYGGAPFMSFINQLNEPVCFFIDEFEKIYEDRKAQESILSILDGITNINHLFILTSNESQKYNKYLINRPGRIHYLRQYNRIPDDVLEEIAKLLSNEEHKEEFIDVMNGIEDANIDMALALVYECNSYNEPPNEAATYLNILAGEMTFNVEIEYPSGVKVTDTIRDEAVNISPSYSFNIYYPDYYIVNEQRVPSTEFRTEVYKKQYPEFFIHPDPNKDNIDYVQIDVSLVELKERNKHSVVYSANEDYNEIPVKVTFRKVKTPSVLGFV